MFSAILLLQFMSGCGGGGEIKEQLPNPMIQAIADNEPPGRVTDFSTVHEDGIVTLGWNSVWEPDLRGVLIRRSSTGYPSNPLAPDSDSDRILYSGLMSVYTDMDLRHNVKYYYAAYTYDDVPNYSEPEYASTTAFFDPFMFVVVPDTQYYTLDYPHLLHNMMQWVVDSRESENIKFLLHEGDITHNNSVSEWTNASESFGILETGNVPYAFCQGNHDDTGGDTSNMNTYLPVSRYRSTSTFGGVYESGKMDNTYHYFSAGGTDWMVISLEYNPRDEVLEWANDITSDNPGRKVILITHAYVYVDDDLGSIGRNIWDKFVKNHSNILFVFNGHYTAAEGARLVSTGDNGNKVYQMFANYQDLTFGGLGCMRLVSLSPEDETVSVKTYCWYTSEYRADDVNQFEFENVEFGALE